MQKSVHFDCGCEINVIDGNLKVEFEKLRFDCPKTWEVYKDGQTQSIFQLEKYLGKKYSKKLKPSSIPDAAALISIIRPGTLQAQNENGISLTDVYCSRKNNDWESSDSILDILLKDTYGINIYQESSMSIARDVAGFDGVQQMKLIKGIGKKKAEILFALRKEFIEGCLKVNKITEEEANSIFDNIEASARYAFNKCILGTQRLRKVSNNDKEFHPTVEELYKITTDINYAKNTGHLSLYKKHKLKKCFGFALSKCQDGRIRKNKIVNIQPAGIRQCYIVTTQSGKTCEVTDNHKFPTPNGDRQLKDLRVGDELYVCGEYEKTNKKYGWSNYNNSQIRFLRKNGKGKVPHGNFKTFAKHAKKLKSKNICASCGSTPQRLEIHHINGDRTNNSMQNLKPLCVSCHKKEEYASGRTRRGEKGYPVLTEKIISIELGSIGMTYDIEMEAPNHNYVLSTNILSLNSHAASYAVTGYWTAWVKAHLPHHYICAWLRNAKNEQKPLEEIRAMISESRRLDIEVLPPSITNLPATNFFIKNKKIFFGIESIKGCGEKGLQKLMSQNIDFSSLSWLDFLVLYSHLANKTQIKHMIRCGCFDFTGESRVECEFQYNQWCLLNKTDVSKAIAIYEEKTPYTLIDLLELLVEKVTTKRAETIRAILQTLRNPPISLHDTIDNIVDHEKELMGINVSCSKIQKSSVPETSDTCADVEKGLKKSYLVVGEISEFREIKIKNGKMAGQIMASFILEDDSGQCDCVVFPKELNLYQGGLYDGNIILAEGPPSNRSNGIIINKIFEV